jgi:hypothetical protein
MSVRPMVVSLLAGLALAALGDGAAAAAAPAASSAAPMATVRYQRPRDPGLEVYADFLRSGHLLEFVADSVNAQFQLPADLTLIGAQCGAANAFYDYDRRTITLCYEYLAHFDALQAEVLTDETGEVDQEELDRSLFGAAEFVLRHEVGHALIHLLDLPVVGREEEAVDQLAAVMLIEEGDEAAIAVALDGAYTFLLRAAATAATAEGVTPLADEHALDEQRYYNITCWIYGSDPAVFADLVGDGLLPEARAARCPSEWAQAASGWARLLDPHRATGAVEASLPSPPAGGKANRGVVWD